MPHDAPHRAGHNHAPAADAPFHLHSHMDPADRAKELATLATQFIEGFREAADKTSYLRLAGVPFETAPRRGRSVPKLVDIELAYGYQIGTASPGFGSRELVYMPYPGQMVRERTTMTFVYVSLDERVDVDLVDWLESRYEAGALG